MQRCAVTGLHDIDEYIQAQLLLAVCGNELGKVTTGQDQVWRKVLYSDKAKGPVGFGVPSQVAYF